MYHISLPSGTSSTTPVESPSFLFLLRQLYPASHDFSFFRSLSAMVFLCFPLTTSQQLLLFWSSDFRAIAIFPISNRLGYPFDYLLLFRHSPPTERRPLRHASTWNHIGTFILLSEIAVSISLEFKGLDLEFIIVHGFISMESRSSRSLLV